MPITTVPRKPSPYAAIFCIVAAIAFFIALQSEPVVGYVLASIFATLAVMFFVDFIKDKKDKQQ